MAFKKLRKALSFRSEPMDEEYLEIDLEQEKKDNKVLIKLFVLKDYEETNVILNAIREGYTIAIIDIRNLKKKDPLELKRAISKIKKTCEAMEGNIAGFGDNIIVTPSFAIIPKDMPKPKEEDRDKRREYFDDY